MITATGRPTAKYWQRTGKYFRHTGWYYSTMAAWNTWTGSGLSSPALGECNRPLQWIQRRTVHMLFAEEKPHMSAVGTASYGSHTLFAEEKPHMSPVDTASYGSHTLFAEEKPHMSAVGTASYGSHAVCWRETSHVCSGYSVVRFTCCLLKINLTCLQWVQLRTVHVLFAEEKPHMSADNTERLAAGQVTWPCKSCAIARVLRYQTYGNNIHVTESTDYICRLTIQY
jgi:hypothetical protein